MADINLVFESNKKEMKLCVKFHLFSKMDKGINIEGFTYYIPSKVTLPLLRAECTASITALLVTVAPLMASTFKL